MKIILSVKKLLNKTDIKRFGTPIVVILVMALLFSNVTYAKSKTVKSSPKSKHAQITKSKNTSKSIAKVSKSSIKTKAKAKKPVKTAKVSKKVKKPKAKIQVKTITKNVAIAFKQVTKKDKKLASKKRKVIQSGKNGLKKVTYQITYKNGKIVSRKILKHTVIRKARNKVVAIGTRPRIIASRGGQPYTRKFVSRTTAYWAVRGIGKTHTASGRLAVRDEGGYSTVAVDPGVIPYGTKIYIEGYGYAVAADCGSGIRGDVIDVFFDTREEACNWGVRHVNVYILQ